MLKGLPKLQLTDLDLMVCKLPPSSEIPANVLEAKFFSVTRTAEELSIVCPASLNFQFSKAEKGWSCFRVEGMLDFALTGILHQISKPLAEQEISLFAISTFNTDYILVKMDGIEKAIAALKRAGFIVI